MSYRRISVAVVMGLFLMCVVTTGLILAEGIVTVHWWSVNGGGDHAEAGSYELDGTIGQPMAGLFVADSLELCSGFACGAAGGGPSLPYLPLILRGHP